MHLNKQALRTSLIANRTVENAARMMADLQIGQGITLQEAENNLGSFDIVIQTTPQE